MHLNRSETLLVVVCGGNKAARQQPCKRQHWRIQFNLFLAARDADAAKDGAVCECQDSNAMYLRQPLQAQEQGRLQAAVLQPSHCLLCCCKKAPVPGAQGLPHLHEEHSPLDRHNVMLLETDAVLGMCRTLECSK